MKFDVKSVLNQSARVQILSITFLGQFLTIISWPMDGSALTLLSKQNENPTGDHFKSSTASFVCIL